VLTLRPPLVYRRQVQPVQTGGLPVQLVQVQAGPVEKAASGAT